MLRTRLVAGATSGFVLSAVFATVLTVARFADAYIEPLRVSPNSPAPVTLRLPRTRVQFQAINSRDATERDNGHLDRVVPRGSALQGEPLASSVVDYEARRRPPRPTLLAAHLLVFFLLVVMATGFMRRLGSDRAGLLRGQVSLFGMCLAFLVAAKFILLLTPWPVFVLPVALVPLLAALYVDRRTAATLGLLLSLCTSALCEFDPVATVVFTISTVTSALSFTQRKRAGMLVVASLLGGLVGAVVYIAAAEIYDGFNLSLELDRGLLSGPASALVGSLAAGLSAYILHVPVARMLGIVSRSELLNLSDLEQPLLQRMAERAPGSWEHSRMMANLAEAAAVSIGADALLTRVGAYYHDLGKSVQPKYFVENLGPGETSPHDSLTPDVSADAIMAHVVEGVRILREGDIPEAVVEFAYTHHGTSVIEFFWHKCKKEGNPKELSEQAFRYPGMRPRTKETGILMLIDAIEAGARTVDPPSRKKFSELVRRVIFTKLQQGQLDETRLSLQDLRMITARITDSLCSAYHSRIRYPWQEQTEQLEKAKSPSHKGGEDKARQTPSTPPAQPGIASAPPAVAAQAGSKVVDPVASTEADSSILGMPAVDVSAQHFPGREPSLSRVPDPAAVETSKDKSNGSGSTGRFAALPSAPSVVTPVRSPATKASVSATDDSSLEKQGSETTSEQPQ